MFKIAFEIMTFLHLKNYKKHCLLLQATFEIPFSYKGKIVNRCLLSTITNVVDIFPAWVTFETFKKSYVLWSHCCNIFSLLQRWSASKTKSKPELCMKAINCACLKLEEKGTRSVKKSKNNFINIIGDRSPWVLDGEN